MMLPTTQEAFRLSSLLQIDTKDDILSTPIQRF